MTLARVAFRPGQVWTAGSQSKEKKIITPLASIRKIDSYKSSSVQEESGETEICDTFESSYDILKTHQRVLNILKREMEIKKKELKEEIDKVKLIALRDEKDKRHHYDKIIDELQVEFDYICTGRKMQEYENKVKNTLEKFSEITKNTGRGRKVIDIFTGQELVSESKDDKDNRISLIFDFAKIAKKYAPVSITLVKIPKNVCVNCDMSLNDYTPDDRGIVICINCGAEKKYVKETTYIETKQGVVEVKAKKTKTEYYDISNFKKLVDAFQGRTTNKLPPKEEIVKQLNAYFSKHDMPSCEEVQNMEPDYRGKRGKLNMAKLFEIFAEIGHKEYCEDAWLIANIALGWSLPDLTKYENKIYDHYQKTQNALNNIKDKSRSSSINRHFRLFKHLELVGYPCNFTEDFKASKMKETLKANEELWKQMCEGADDESIYYIPTF